MGRAHGDVQHVGADGVAVALCAAEPALTCGDDLGTREVVVECGEVSLGLRGVTDDVTVFGNEGDAASDDLAQAIGLSIEIGSRDRRGLRQQVSDEIRLVTQVALDLGALPFPHLPGQHDRQRQQRERGGDECPEEDFGSKPGFHTVPDIARREV